MMGRLRESLLSLFRRNTTNNSTVNDKSTSDVSDATTSPRSSDEKHNIKKPRPNPGAQSTTNKKKPHCDMFNILPYTAYQSYSSIDRYIVNLGAARIFKTAFSSEALTPLDDEGVGRLKGVFEAWVPRNGSITKDKISGVIAISLVSTNNFVDTIDYAGKSINRKIEKHHVQCTYSGTGIRRGCRADDDRGFWCIGAELWIKASLPLTKPWIQDMYVPPHERLNRLCLLAAPSPDFAIYKHSQNEIAQLPTLTAKPGNPVFKLDSDVYIYLCRLVPCSTICHTTKPSAKNAKEPPMFETPRTIRRSATISTTSALANKRTNIAQHQRSNTPCAQSHVLKPGKTRSIYIHLLSDFTKKGGLKDGGARLMLPGSIQLSNGDGIHLQDVSPGSEITIKNIGIDRAQFFLVDMPGYLDETETLSI